MQVGHAQIKNACPPSAVPLPEPWILAVIATPD